jgi:hypothetical protein
MRLLFAILTLCLVSAEALPQPKILFLPKNSGEHAIPGTRIKLRLSDGFRVSRSFNGIQNGSAVIEFFDIPGAKYETILSDMTSEKLANQGFQLQRVDSLTVAGEKGTMFFLGGEGDQKTISLVFGNTQFTVIAVASYPSAAASVEQQLVDMLLSIRYGEDNSAVLADASFVLDDSASRFRFRKYAANTFYYTAEGIQSIRDSDSYMAVTQLAWDYSTSPAVIGELMLLEMEKHGVVDTVVKRRSNRSVNGYRAFESEIVARKNGSPCTIYQMVVVHNDKAVVIHGIDPGNVKKATDSFRKLARTVQLR